MILSLAQPQNKMLKINFIVRNRPAFWALCCLLVVLTTTSFRGQEKLSARTYYVDANLGADGNDGLSKQWAWKSLEKVNSVPFLPGDKLLFKAGEKWVGQLRPKGSGNDDNEILISSYGDGAKPIIAGNGIENGTIYLYNQQYFTIKNLEVTNYNSSEQGGQSLKDWETENNTSFVEPILPPQFKNTNTFKYGIFVLAQDAGVVSGIKLINLEVHGVNGFISQADEKSKDNGGIVFKIVGTQKPTYFNGVLIDSCNVHDVDRSGVILSTSSWSKRTLNSNTNWTPSLKVVVRNTKFSNTGANALIVRVAKNPIMEHNLFDHCAIKASGNAGFSFNCDDAIWQFNECRYTKANIDDRDAGGIDADYNAKNTVLQYNFVHDNDYGMLITGGPGKFNDGTVVRYNIFENDGKFAHPTHGKCIIRVSGSTTDTYIYNNVIYLGKNQKDTKIVSCETWQTSPSTTFFQNNIFYNLSRNAFYDFGESKGNKFEANLYFGQQPQNQPKDKKGIYKDPMFVNAGIGKPKGYVLQKGSPATHSGIAVINNGGRDYFGTSLKAGIAPSIGIYEFR